MVSRRAKNLERGKALSASLIWVSKSVDEEGSTKPKLTNAFIKPPSLLHFLRNKAENEVWWHTHERKLKGKYVTDPQKKRRKRSGSARGVTPDFKDFGTSHVPAPPQKTDPGPRHRHPYQRTTCKNVEKPRAKLPRALDPSDTPSCILRDQLANRKKLNFSAVDIRVDIDHDRPNQEGVGCGKLGSSGGAQSDWMVRRKKIIASATFAKNHRRPKPSTKESLDDDDDSDQVKFTFNKTDPVKQVLIKYFKEDLKPATIGMEKMVSDLKDRILKERLGVHRRGSGPIFVEKTMSGLVATLQQDDIIDTRALLKQAERQMCKQLEMEVSSLSVELNRLQTIRTQKLHEEQHLDVELKNRESQIKLIENSLGMVAERKKVIDSRWAVASKDLLSVELETLKLNHMLERDTQLLLKAKKLALTKSQEIKAVRRYYDSLFELGNEALRMQEEVQYECDNIALEHAEHTYIIRKELLVDKLRAEKVEKAKHDISFRTERRKLIKAGHDFTELERALDGQGKTRSGMKVSALMHDGDVHIKYGKKEYSYKEMEQILYSVHRQVNFSSGEITPDAWLLDIHRQEDRLREMKDSVAHHEQLLVQKKKHLLDLKASGPQTCALQKSTTGANSNESVDIEKNVQDVQSSSAFIRVEEALQDQIRASELHIEALAHRDRYTAGLLATAKLGVASLSQKVSAEDLPGISFREQQRRSNSVGVNKKIVFPDSMTTQLNKFMKSILAVEDSIRSFPKSRFAPQTIDGHLQFDSLRHNVPLTGRYNRRIAKEEFMIAHTKTFTEEINDDALNAGKRKEMKTKERKLLNRERRRSGL